MFSQGVGGDYETVWHCVAAKQRRKASLLQSKQGLELRTGLISIVDHQSTPQPSTIYMAQSHDRHSAMIRSDRATTGLLTKKILRSSSSQHLLQSDPLQPVPLCLLWKPSSPLLCPLLHLQLALPTLFELSLLAAHLRLGLALARLSPDPPHLAAPPHSRARSLLLIPLLHLFATTRRFLGSALLLRCSAAWRAQLRAHRSLPERSRPNQSPRQSRTRLCFRMSSSGRPC